MDTLIYFITGVAVIIGATVVIWSFVDTRKKYYNEYKSRRKTK
jgi:hypothetical protein